ncbi:MAG: PocR ligand-binding domain-containing protein [Magnetococcales bacterium]|nr:PocR ligand-binding domain-containing protein [Magnetococcales bacterium]
MDFLAKAYVTHSRIAWTLVLIVSLVLALLLTENVQDFREQERLSQLKIDTELRRIEVMSQTLNGNHMGALGLLGLIDKEVKREALNDLAPNGPSTVTLLENITRAHDADGTFIVGQDGIIKSSWGVGKPLTGVDVKFRPYFHRSLQGQQNVYAAIGTTTGLRTLYFAAPIRAGESIESPTIGAVVIRSGVTRLDTALKGSSDIALLLSPQGIVFASTRPEWIGRMEGAITPERIQEVRTIKQFGTMFDTKDPEPLPLSLEPGIVSLEGGHHAVAQTKVQWNDLQGAWTLVLIEDLARTVPVSQRLWMMSGILALLLIVSGLFFGRLHGHHFQTLTAQTLEANVQAQRESAHRKEAVAASALLMQQTRSAEELAGVFLHEMRTRIGALQGVVYLLADDGSHLWLAASHACHKPPPQTIVLGEGLLGQCARDRCWMVVETAEQYWRIRSGLGSAMPTNTMLVPITLHDELLGMVELAMLKRVNDGDRALLLETIPLLALNIKILLRSKQTEEILAATEAAERASTERASFQQVLMDTIPYPVFYQGADTRFLGFNRSFEATFGVGHADLVGKRILDLDHLSESDRIACQEENEVALAHVGSVQREMRFNFADGRMHDTLYFVSGFCNADGSPGGLVGTIVDMSSIRAAERKLERLADIERFNRLAQGRENRILELKKEVNTLVRELGRPPLYLSPDRPDAQKGNLPNEAESEPNDLAIPSLAQVGITIDKLLDLDQLQSMFDGFCHTVGVAAALIDLEGKILAASRWQRACTDFHRVNPDSCARCIESDTELALKLETGAEFTMYRCKNGMTDCASPIIVEGHHLANVFIGQFHVGAPDMTFFDEQARRFGYPEGDYRNAVMEAPVLDENRLASILGFLAGFSRMVTIMSLDRHRADAAQKLLERQADVLRHERMTAMSLAEDADSARRALEQGGHKEMRA